MNRRRKIYKVTLTGAAANFGLLVFKAVAGIVGNSSAMIADAVHSLSDFVTDIIVMAFVKIAGKPRDVDHQYGHGKYETMATAAIGFILIGVGLGIFYNGVSDIWRFAHGEKLVEPGMIALIAALVSIVVKEILYRYTVYVGKKVESTAVIANAWHHRSDAFSSIATTIGIGGALLLGPNWVVLDPIAAVLVSFLIVKTAVTLVIPSINELLEKSLPEQTKQEILEVLNKYPQVSNPHNLRTRRIGPVASVEMHIRVNPQMTVAESHEITKHIEADLRELLGAETLINIHVEPLKPEGNH